MTSGVGVQVGGGDCGNCDEDCVPAGGGGALPGRGLGCGGGVHGAGTYEEEPAGAGAGACDDGCLAPAVKTSCPSCDPWSSCCR